MTIPPARRKKASSVPHLYHHHFPYEVGRRRGEQQLERSAVRLIPLEALPRGPPQGGRSDGQGENGVDRQVQGEVQGHQIV